MHFTLKEETETCSEIKESLDHKASVSGIGAHKYWMKT